MMLRRRYDRAGLDHAPCDVGIFDQAQRSPVKHPEARSGLLPDLWIGDICQLGDRFARLENQLELLFQEGLAVRLGLFVGVLLDADR